MAGFSLHPLCDLTSFDGNRVMLQIALFYLAIGISVIPLRPRSKRPLVEWREFTERLPTEQELRSWFPPGGRHNIAGVMGTISRLVAIDADNCDAARQLSATLPATAMRTKTPRGLHLLFRLRPGQVVAPRVHTAVRGVPADIRGDGSYVALGGSVHPSGGRYERIGTWQREEVPFFEESWLSPNLDRCTSLPQKQREPVRNVDRYLARIESIQGRHGSAGLVRACAICREAGLSESETTIALLRWNALSVVSPPWSHAELARAITRIYAGQT